MNSRQTPAVERPGKGRTMPYMVIFLLVVIGLLMLAAMLTAIKDQRELNRKISEVFGVPRKQLSYPMAKAMVEGLAYKTGLLMLTEEALQKQLDPCFLSPSVEDRVVPLARQFKGRASLRAEILEATAMVAKAYTLAMRAKIRLPLPTNPEGWISIALMPPYNEAEQAKANTAAHKQRRPRRQNHQNYR